MTANHDTPVAKVKEISNKAARNRLPPTGPKPEYNERPTNWPRMPPLPAEKFSATPKRRCASPVDETRNPTMPTRRSAGPRSASPSPSVSMPNKAIQAIAPSMSGSRKAI